MLRFLVIEVSTYRVASRALKGEYILASVESEYDWIRAVILLDKLRHPLSADRTGKIERNIGSLRDGMICCVEIGVTLNR
jgi:hypothetical protein